MCVCVLVKNFLKGLYREKIILIEIARLILGVVHYYLGVMHKVKYVIVMGNGKLYRKEDDM